MSTSTTHTGTTAAHSAGPTDAHHATIGADLEDCITGCLACQAICLQTMYHCLKVGGARASADHIRTLLDCAALCGASVQFMLAESPFQGRICALCAEACRECEAACRRMGDVTDLRCADSCRRCAEMLPHAA
jgi:hypothetical protein